MSETPQDQTTGEQTEAPPTGENAPPSVPPVTPPEPDHEPEAVGRTPESEAGDPPQDGEGNGVGTAPTQPGDVDDEGNGGHTTFQTTEQIEHVGDGGGEDAA